ncbi:MAG TPA: peptidoglycan DD-metalloendopeptidase family protein, partial [Thermoleophilaceae bacterium]|nr:peptidoglycan DD-metalloendopeptidase family protein [Thermoleophilaceae bacterium]
MTNAHRDLAAPELWTHSLERSRRRRELLPKGRRENNRRKHLSAALATAVVTGPSAPLAAAQVSGDVNATIAAESPANRAIEIREGGLPLQVGSEGGLVAHVQKALKITADGVFGPQTDAAVRSYQASAGLEVDGIVGLATWAALFEQNTASGAAIGASNIPPQVKQRVEAKLAQAGRDLAADGRVDGDVGAQNTPAPQGPTANAAPPATGGAPDAQTQTTTPAPAGEACGSTTIASPVRGTVTSNFGPRWGRNHDGIDIAAPTGTPVRAAACGTVSLAGQQSGYGNMVCITHTSQFSTCYAHLSRFGVTDGARVTQGQVIGYVGCTGSCTGPHLHFETRVGGQAQDPRTYLSGGAIPGTASTSTASTANIGGPDLPQDVLEQAATVTASGGYAAPAAPTASTQTSTAGNGTVTWSDGTAATGEVVTGVETTAPDAAVPAEPVAGETAAAAPGEPVAVEAEVAAPVAPVEPVAVEA